MLQNKESQSKHLKSFQSSDQLGSLYVHFWCCTNSSFKLHQNIFAFYHSIALYVAQFTGNLRNFQKCFWDITNISLIGSVIIMAAFYKYLIYFMKEIMNKKWAYNKYQPTQNCIFYPIYQHVSAYFVSPGAISAKQNANIHQYFYLKYNCDEIPMSFLLRSRSLNFPLFPSYICVTKNLHPWHIFCIQIHWNYNSLKYNELF